MLCTHTRSYTSHHSRWSCCLFFGQYCKLCGAYQDGCEFVTSLQQHHPCPHHPDSPLVHSHGVAPCSVEFVYIKPVNPDDKRRWLTGITRDQKTNKKNSLHSHSLHAAMSLPSRVKTEFTKAAVRNPHLKTRDLALGMCYNFAL